MEKLSRELERREYGQFEAPRLLRWLDMKFPKQLIEQEAFQATEMLAYFEHIEVELWVLNDDQATAIHC